MAKKRNVCTKDVLVEMGILLHSFIVINDIDGELPPVLRKLQGKIAVIVSSYKQCVPQAKKLFDRLWMGIDQRSRNEEYYPEAYIAHMLLLYKYDYRGKKIGKALWMGINEEELTDILENMEECGVDRKMIDMSISFADKVYNKLLEYRG